MNINVNETYTCLLNSKGKVYTFGWNENGQCNIDNVSSENKAISSLTFSQIESCNNFSILMNNKGELSKGFDKYNGILFNGFVSNHADSVYAWKDNYFYRFQENNIGKYKINISVKKNSVIKKIACGKNFVMFLSDGGAVYDSEVDNGTFISNVAGCNGSAIYKGISILSYFEDNDVYETTIYNYDLHVDDVSNINQGEKLKVILGDSGFEALGYDITVDVYEITESKEILKDKYHVLSGDSFIINYTNGLYKFKCSLNRSGVISHDREIKVHGKLSINATHDAIIYVSYMDEDCYTITY